MDSGTLTSSPVWEKISALWQRSHCSALFRRFLEVLDTRTKDLILNSSRVKIEAKTMEYLQQGWVDGEAVVLGTFPSFSSWLLPWTPLVLNSRCIHYRLIYWTTHSINHVTSICRWSITVWHDWNQWQTLGTLLASIYVGLSATIPSLRDCRNIIQQHREKARSTHD